MKVRDQVKAKIYGGTLVFKGYEANIVSSTLSLVSTNTMELSILISSPF